MMYMIYVMHNLYKDFSLIPYKKNMDFAIVLMSILARLKHRKKDDSLSLACFE